MSGQDAARDDLSLTRRSWDWPDGAKRPWTLQKTFHPFAMVSDGPSWRVGLCRIGPAEMAEPTYRAVRLVEWVSVQHAGARFCASSDSFRALTGMLFDAPGDPAVLGQVRALAHDTGTRFLITVLPGRMGYDVESRKVFVSHDFPVAAAAAVTGCLDMGVPAEDMPYRPHPEGMPSTIWVGSVGV